MTQVSSFNAVGLPVTELTDPLNTVQLSRVSGSIRALPDGPAAANEAVKRDQRQLEVGTFSFVLPFLLAATMLLAYQSLRRR